MATIRGGDRLRAELARLSRNVTRAANLRVGFLEGATAADGQSIPLRAALNEFGTKRQPPRPFFRNMVAAKSGEWPEAIGNLLVANGYDADRTLDQAGAAIAGQLRQSITELVSPPLSPVTIAKKGFDKPLIETSAMLKSVDHEVE